VAEIIKFPSFSQYQALKVSGEDKHNVFVQVTDRRQPEEARWYLQWPMLRAAGGRCLKGFKNEAARRGAWHRFSVRRTLLRRFLLDIEHLVAQGRVVVEVDGRLVRIAKQA
jgi:hypothetical protein